MPDKNNKKRILIFSTAYFPLIGGAEVAVREITKRIDEFEFVMVAPKLDKDLPAREKIDNVDIHRLGQGNNRDKFKLILSGPKYARSLGQFDWVWAIMASYGGLAALRYKKQNKSVPFLLTLQEGDSKAHIYSRVWFVWPIFKQIFKRADKIQAISHYLAHWARRLGAKGDITIVPNGVTMVEAGGAAGAERDKCGHKRIITVSRLVKKNGVEDLIRALSYLAGEVHLTIVGDGPLRGKLENLVKKKGLERRVHFVGAIAPDKVVDYLKNSDVFCRPSLSEGLGNAFLEAMAMGVPVVGTAVGGIPDFLKEGETGWFCAVKNPTSIAEKIKYILDEKNKAAVARVTETARKMVEEKYNWDKIALAMKGLFGGGG